MPIVNLTVSKDHATTSMLSALIHACQEFIPAGLNTRHGPLKPGDVEVAYHVQEIGMESDLVVVVTAMNFPDRKANIDERAEAIQMAFDKEFPGVRTSLFISLVDGAWVSWRPAVDVVDMSMEAARARFRGHDITP